MSHSGGQRTIDVGRLTTGAPTTQVVASDTATPRIRSAALIRLRRSAFPLAIILCLHTGALVAPTTDSVARPCPTPRINATTSVIGGCSGQHSPAVRSLSVSALVAPTTSPIARQCPTPRINATTGPDHLIGASGGRSAETLRVLALIAPTASVVASAGAATLINAATSVVVATAAGVFGDSLSARPQSAAPHTDSASGLSVLGALAGYRALATDSGCLLQVASPEKNSGVGIGAGCLSTPLGLGAPLISRHLSCYLIWLVFAHQKERIGGALNAERSAYLVVVVSSRLCAG